MSRKEKRWVINLLITAFFLAYVAPVLSSGYHFNGGFLEGVVYALLFTGMLWVINWLLGLFIVGTVGIGAVLYLLFKGLFWWLIPAIELKILAGLFPAHLAIDGWGTAIWVGLMMMVINLVTLPLKRAV